MRTKCPTCRSEGLSFCREEAGDQHRDNPITEGKDYYVMVRVHADSAEDALSHFMRTPQDGTIVSIGHQIMYRWQKGGGKTVQIYSAFNWKKIVEQVSIPGWWDVSTRAYL